MLEKIKLLKSMLLLIDWQNSILFATDSYKFSHYFQYPIGTEFIESYVEPRKETYYSMKVLAAGIADCANKYFARPITAQEVEAAALFAELHGVPFYKEGWMRIVNEFGGYLPIEIRGLPEGTPVKVKNAVAVIRNTVPGFGWVVGWCEPAILRSIWYKSTVATYSAVIKKVIAEGCNGFMDKEALKTYIKFSHHDFGSRGVSSGESAAIGGSAHAMSSWGSDTVEGIIHTIMNFDVETMPCFSVPAAEHSTVTIYLRNGEYDAIKNMINTFGDKYKIISFVADSYDLLNNVKMVVSLRQEIEAKNLKFVIRPDSGVPHESILSVFTALYHLRVLVSEGDYWALPNWLGVLQGDGICIESIKKINQVLIASGFSPVGLVFGQGGQLLQAHTRDDFGWAMKCSYAVIDGVGRDVFKDPITDKNKKSKKGQIKLISANGEHITILSSEDENFDSHFDLLTPVYRFDPAVSAVPFVAVQKWSDIQERVNSFIFG